MTSAKLELLMDEAELGKEYLIRVRVVEVREETIDVTRLGDDETRVLSGVRSARLLPLSVRGAASKTT